MKIHNSLISIIISLLFVIACNKYECYDSYNLTGVKYYNTTIDEVESVKIVGYEQGSNFTKLIDSGWYVTKIIQNPEYKFEFTTELNKNLRTNLDYMFTFPATGRKCEITEIKVNEDICQDGIFNDEYSRSFGGYLVNGDHYACQVITVNPVYE